MGTHLTTGDQLVVGIAATCAIRQGQDWKLIYYYETGAKELFNLKDDLGEATNLALTNPEKVNECIREAR